MKLIKTKVSVIVLSVFFACSKAHAFTDFANLAENIFGNIQEMNNWLQEKAIMIKQMDQMGLMEKLNIDNSNNGMANSIVRNGRAMQDVQNLEVLEMSVPDKDACGTISLQILDEDTTCLMADGVVDDTEDFLAKESNFSDTPEEVLEKAQKVAKAVVAECSALSSGEKNPLQDSLCTRASILSGGTTSGTHTEEERRASKQMASILVGSKPEYKQSQRLSGDKAVQREAQVEEMRKIAAKAVAHTSLTEIAAIRAAGGDGKSTSPSKMQLFEEFVNDRWGNATWMATLTNTGKDELKNTVYPSEVMRKMAAMQAFSVNLQLEQYKQQLRQETILATNLALEVEPLKR